ncbi:MULTISPECIES: sensor domain-containing diguanylate cyclase [unclassified Exiguobacterium]|uniref:sensor domain-containing diguanylate cyclase n=1 Tax=unclassified Exiguobacterium TaxID=2644629 RepID=UPI001BE9167D|nr:MULTISPECIES: sensor domain-containing diguanylate cyclase [unclassified Exiguobacterium]
MLVLGMSIGIIMALIFTKLQKPDEASQLSVELIGHHTKDVIYVYEVKPIQRFRYISPSLDEHIGDGVVDASYADPAVCFDRIHPDDFDILIAKISGTGNYDTAFLQRWRTNDGRYVWFEEYTTPIYENDELVAIQGIIRNVEQAITEKNELEKRCRTDALTGLYNRYQFDNMISELMPCQNVPLAILLFDLNDLKIQNDHHGHAAGDELLKLTAFALKQHSQNVYRIGGDEFAIIESHLTLEEIETLRAGIHAEMDKMHIALASGFANGMAQDVEQLIMQADAAMYIDKSTKKIRTSSTL